MIISDWHLACSAARNQEQILASLTACHMKELLRIQGGPIKGSSLSPLGLQSRILFTFLQLVEA